MTRPVKIAVICLSVLLALSVGANIYLWVSEGNALAKWVEESARLRLVSQEHQKARDKAEAEAERLKGVVSATASLVYEKDKLIEGYKKAVTEAGKPPSDAFKYTKPRDRVIKAQEEKIDLLEAGKAACEEVVENLEIALVESKASEKVIEKRADGWERNTKKARRRYRAKTALAVIGVGAVAGVGGYYAGRASK